MEAPEQVSRSKWAKESLDVKSGMEFLGVIYAKAGAIIEQRDMKMTDPRVTCIRYPSEASAPNLCITESIHSLPCQPDRLPTTAP